MPHETSPPPSCSLDAFPALLAWTLVPLAVGTRVLAPAGTDAPMLVLSRHGAGPSALASACWEAWSRLWTSIGRTASSRETTGSDWTAMLFAAADDLWDLARRVAEAPPPSEDVLGAALAKSLAGDPNDHRTAAAEADSELAAWMRVAIRDDDALDVLANGRARMLFEHGWRKALSARPALLASVMLAERLTGPERHEVFAAASATDVARDDLDARATAIARRLADRSQARRDTEDLAPPTVPSRWGDEPQHRRALALSGEAAVAVARGRFDEAAERFERTVEADERRPKDWLGLARARFELGEWDAGMTAYRRAIDLDAELRITPHGIELLRVLDRGSLSIRFLARSGDGDFVVEPLPPRLVSSARLAAVETRCLHLTRADHPDLVRSQLLRHGYHAMLVTPCVRGMGFGEQPEEELDAERVFHLVDRVCEQIEALHAAGIVHGRLAMSVLAMEWPRVRVAGIALEPLFSSEPAVMPGPDVDVYGIGQLLSHGLSRLSRRGTTVAMVYRPLVELLSMTLGPPDSRASLGRFRTALNVIRFDPGVLEILEPD